MEEAYKVSSLSDLIGFENEEEKFEYQKEILSLKFVKVIDNFLSQNTISRKKLAEDTDYSPSYISQVFCAHKPVNMDFLVKIQNALGLPFEVKLGDYHESPNYMDTVYNARHDKLKSKDRYSEYCAYKGVSENTEEERLEG